MVVLHVGLEVVCQLIDAGREERDLHFGRARVSLGPLVLGDDFRLVDVCNRHIFPFESSL
jgi:hypothetical protein